MPAEYDASTRNILGFRVGVGSHPIIQFFTTVRCRKARKCEGMALGLGSEGWRTFEEPAALRCRSPLCRCKNRRGTELEHQRHRKRDGIRTLYGKRGKSTGLVDVVQGCTRISNKPVDFSRNWSNTSSEREREETRMKDHASFNI